MKVREDTGRVVALAVTFFGVLGIAGAVAGVFERIGPGLTLALGLFAGAFALATYVLDRDVRAFVRSSFPRKRESSLERGRVSAGFPPARERRALTKAPAKSPGGKPAAT